MLKEDSIAPDFTLKDADGVEHTLSQYVGSWVLIYFYPKDDTAGCTKEACMLRDAFPQYEAQKITILGISRDSTKSHAAFSTRYDLPFTLLSDPDMKVIAQYGAKGPFGAKRISYLIAPDGTVAKAYSKVDPSKHAEEVLLDMAELAYTA